MSALRQGEPGHDPYMVEQGRRSGFQHRDAGQLRRFLAGQLLGEGALPGRQSQPLPPGDRQEWAEDEGRAARWRGRGEPCCSQEPTVLRLWCLRGTPIGQKKPHSLTSCRN